MEEECNLDVLKLDHYMPEDFEQCICQRQEEPSVTYLIFLRVMELYFQGMLISHFILNCLGYRVKDWIFLDFWVLLLFSVTAVFQLNNVGRFCRNYSNDYVNTPWDYRIYWIIFSMGLPANLLSSIVFWTQVYQSDSSAYAIVLNTVSSILCVCNFLLAAIPLRLLHFFYFVIFFVVYILFTVIYQKCGGTGVNGSIPIYERLDWRCPGKAILAAFICLLIGVGLYLLFCFISMGKFWLRDRQLYR